MFLSHCSKIPATLEYNNLQEGTDDSSRTYILTRTGSVSQKLQQQQHNTALILTIFLDSHWRFNASIRACRSSFI